MSWGSHLRLDDQQAAALFRLCIQNGFGGCQYEGDRMRWWLPQGLLLELVDHEWYLTLVPSRRGWIDDELGT